MKFGSSKVSFNVSVLDETVRRWKVFAQKIRSTADELHAAGFEEAVRLRAASTSAGDNQSYLFWNGVGGQIEALRSKAQATFENQVLGAFQELAGDPENIWSRHGLRAEVQELWQQLQAESNELDQHLLHLSCTNPADFDTTEEDEASYLRILADHERLKGAFFCLNCGGGIAIDKVLFLSTYVACPYCKTQNTFEPSDEARSLPALAERLAEKEALPAKERWNEARSRVPNWSAENSALWHERKQYEVQCHVDYLHARFDAIDRIVPELKPQNDLARNNRIAEARKPIASR